MIGAGPAGITLARELIGLPLHVSVIESGWFESDARAQELNCSKVESRYYAADALAVGRRRQFGGTANAWTYRTEPGSDRRYARSLPPEAIDFEPRQDGKGGWPFALGALHPFFERAQKIWNGGPFDYEPATWARSATPPLQFRDGEITTRMCQHGPHDVFSLRYRDDLLAADNVTIHLGCTALQLESEAARASVRKVRVARGDGSTFEIEAKIFVLACGGVENVQLLLLSDVARPGAPANLHDNVGRYFSDHPEFCMGTIIPADQEVIGSLGLYDLHWVGRFMVSGFLTIAEEIKRHHGLLNVSAALVPRERGFGSRAHQSLTALRAMWRGEWPEDALNHVGAILRAPGDVAAIVKARNRGYREYRGGWSGPAVDRRRFGAIELWAATEQTADRENRMTLSAERDPLGRNQVRLQWNWSESDRKNIARSMRIFAERIDRERIGRFVPWVDFEGAARPFYAGLHHPMGGTRMHPDPRHGVVDANCRVHGTENLFVAGSSAFSSGHGYANPTLTILALAVRLADHLKALA